MNYRKLLAAVFTALFLVFSLFQHNDPDAQLWVSIYSAAALASFLAALDRLPLHLHLVVLGLALVGAGLLSPELMREIERLRGLQQSAPNPLLKSAAKMEYEVVKEIAGLLIVALAFGVLYLAKRRASSV